MRCPNQKKGYSLHIAKFLSNSSNDKPPFVGTFRLIIITQLSRSCLCWNLLFVFVVIKVYSVADSSSGTWKFNCAWKCKLCSATTAATPVILSHKCEAIKSPSLKRLLCVIRSWADRELGKNRIWFLQRELDYLKHFNLTTLRGYNKKLLDLKQKQIFIYRTLMEVTTGFYRDLLRFNILS